LVRTTINERIKGTKMEEMETKNKSRLQSGEGGNEKLAIWGVYEREEAARE
jgi:hypothetical protein